MRRRPKTATNSALGLSIIFFQKYQKFEDLEKYDAIISQKCKKNEDLAKYNFIICQKYKTITKDYEREGRILFRYKNTPPALSKGVV